MPIIGRNRGSTTHSMIHAPTSVMSAARDVCCHADTVTARAAQVTRNNPCAATRPAARAVRSPVHAVAEPTASHAADTSTAGASTVPTISNAPASLPHRMVDHDAPWQSSSVSVPDSRSRVTDTPATQKMNSGTNICSTSASVSSPNRSPLPPWAAGLKLAVFCRWASRKIDVPP